MKNEEIANSVADLKSQEGKKIQTNTNFFIIPCYAQFCHLNTAVSSRLYYSLQVNLIIITISGGDNKLCTHMASRSSLLHSFMPAVPTSMLACPWYPCSVLTVRKKRTAATEAARHRILHGNEQCCTRTKAYRCQLEGKCLKFMDHFTITKSFTSIRL